MASSADIRAGRAFVELYVRDYLFRQRLLEDRAMLEDVMADAGQRGPTDEGITTTGDAYAELADIADQSLETLYQDTLYLTEATEELLEVLNEVMDTYLGLSDIQTEGVSLAVGGPQQAGIGGPGGEQRFGFSLSDMKKQLGEGMEGVPEVAVKAVGAKIGAAIFRSDAFQNALSYLPFTKTIRQGASKEGAGGQAGTELSVPVMQLLNQTFIALGQSAVLAAQALQAMSRSGGGGGGPVIDVEFKAKGLETVHDEMITALSPVEFHSPGVLPITVSYTADTTGIPVIGNEITIDYIADTTMLPDQQTVTVEYTSDTTALPTLPDQQTVTVQYVADAGSLEDSISEPVAIPVTYATDAQSLDDASVAMSDQVVNVVYVADQASFAEATDVADEHTITVTYVADNQQTALASEKSDEIVDAELAGLPAPGDVVDAELVDSVQSANVVMAQLAKSTSGADTSLARLAQSLQSAGTAIPVVGQDVEKAGQAVGMMTKAFHAAKWALTTLGPWLIAIAAAVAAAYAAFKTLQLAVAAVKLPFQVAAKAVEWFVAGIKSLPNLIGWTVGALKRLTVAGYDAAKSLGAGVWSGVSATFRGINNAISTVGSTIKATGKGMAYLGAGMTALGALVTVPLTKAAQKFAEMGNHIKVLTEQYKVFGMTAEQASVYSYAASQASGLLGTLGEAERIQYLMRTMRTGTAEYEKWRKQAELSGAVMTGGALAGAKVLTEAYHRLTGALQGLWASLGQAVGPAVADWTEIVVGAIRGATQWVRQNQQLIATVSKVATAIGTVGSVIAAAGTALMGLGAAISPLTALLAAVAGGMAVVEYKTRVGATLWGAYSDSVVKLYGTVMTFLKPILEETKKVIGGIVDAVKGGDLALAAKIAWAGLKLAWMEGLLWLSERTGEAFGGILKNLAAGNWKAAADGAMAMLKVSFLHAMNWLDGLWVDVRNAAGDAFTWIGNTAGELYLTVADKLDPMWMWLKRMFGEMKIWGQAAFEELTVYSAGFAAAFADVAGKLKPILIAMAAMNPAMAAVIWGAVKSLSSIKSTAASAFSEAVRSARLDVELSKSNDRLAKAEQERRIRKEIADWESRAAKTGLGGKMHAAEEIKRLKERLAELQKVETVESRSQDRRSEAEQRNRDAEAANTRTKQDREKELDARKRERLQQIAALEQQAAQGGDTGTAARSKADQLKEEIKQLEAEAAKLKEESKQPELPAYLGKSSGLISSSAYAFGSLGMGGGSVQDRQLEIQRKTLEEARKKEVAERASRNSIQKILEAQRDRLAEMTEYMKKMGIFGAT